MTMPPFVTCVTGVYELPAVSEMDVVVVEFSYLIKTAMRSLLETLSPGIANDDPEAVLSAMLDDLNAHGEPVADPTALT